jgi:hypothetical protein
MPQGAPGPLAAPQAPPDIPPAASAIQQLAPLVPMQQSILDAVKQKLAEQTMATAMQAVAGMPNPVAEAAQTEPSPYVGDGTGQQSDEGQGL